MMLFPCSFLQGEVELTQEREMHIAEHHPDLAPDCGRIIKETLADPDDVRSSIRMVSAKMFTRWFADVKGGKHAVVVVVSDPAPACRHWVVTAYIARRLAGGEVLWTRK